MALSVDMRVKTLCKRLGIKFVNNWSHFYGNDKLYHIDGVHLNKSDVLKLESDFFNFLNGQKSNRDFK